MPQSPKTPPTTAVSGAATVIWRKGQWLVQAAHHSSLKPVSPAFGRKLDDAKAKGCLEEVAPGQYRVGAGMALPLLNSAESPLAHLALPRTRAEAAVLDEEQLRAGESLRRDYERAHMGARVTARYETQASSGGRNAQFSDNHIAEMTEATLAARQRLHAALAAVGPELSGILLQVCCMEAGLEQAERHLKLPRRAGKAVLQLALTRLARHYGIKKNLRHAGPGQIGHWAVDDFRPAFPAPHAHQP